MQNSMPLFIFSVFHQKHAFRAKFGSKNQTCRLKLKFGAYTTVIRICKIHWWCSLFSVVDWNHNFRANLVQKIKIVSLSWFLVPRLIRICRIHWCCSLFLFYIVDTFLGKRSWTMRNCNYCGLTGIENLK